MMNDRATSQGPWLVTGAAGFIGFHVARRLLRSGAEVVGLDNLNPYYDPTLKESRLNLLHEEAGFRFERMDLEDRAGMERLFQEEGFGTVIHLAAQAGVRHSLADPWSYVDSNVTGTLNVLEGCRHTDVKHHLFASTSSIYGANRKTPFQVGDGTDHPLTIYAATKKATEAMAHAYADLYAVPSTGLRFFTVYGPWGRPDMALFKFTRSILADEPIDVYGEGKPYRDFTYVDDIVEGILGAAVRPAEGNPEWDATDPDPATSYAPYRLFNIGATRKVSLMRFIEVLEEVLGREARKNYLPMQPGDVLETHADVSRLSALTGYEPRVGFEEGVRRFVEWYLEFYGSGEKVRSSGTG